MAERKKKTTVTKIKMPAAARRGDYEVPDEAEITSEEVVDPSSEIDMETGEPYSDIPGVEEAAGPDDLLDPEHLRSAAKFAIKGLATGKVPAALGTLARLRMPMINPKDLPLESTVRTPLAAMNKEFAEKVMSPNEEAIRMGYSDYLEFKDYPKQHRAEAVKEYVEEYPNKERLNQAAGYMMPMDTPIEDSFARQTTSNRAYVVSPESGGKVAVHEGAHRLLNPIGSIKGGKQTAYEQILNKEIPDNVKDGIEALLKRSGYQPGDRHTEYIPWLTNIVNKQVSLENVPDVRNLTREQYSEMQKNVREVNKYKKALMREFDWEEKDYNEFMKDARKAYNAVVKKAETLTPEQVTKAEQELLQQYSKNTEAASDIAAMKEIVPDIDEDLGLHMEQMKRANPELGEDAKPPSVLRKLRDKYSDMMQEWKASRPEARRKLQERLHNLKLLQEQEEERLKKEAIDTTEREERRKNVRFVPPTQVIEGK